MVDLEVNRVRRVTNLSVTDEPVTIGRASKNKIVLPSSRVSRHHCVIEIVEGAARLRDLDSSGGTRVNGEKVKETALHPGDTIGIASFELVYDAAGAASGVAAARPPANDTDETGITLSEPGSAADRADPDARENAAEAEARLAAIRQREAETVDERRALEREREKIEQARTDLERDREAFERGRATLATEQEALEVARRELQEERDQAHAALSSRLEASEEAGRALREELDQTVATLDAKLQASEQETATQRERTRTLGDEIASLTATLAAQRDETAAAAAAIEVDRDALRERADHLATELERKTRTLEAAVQKTAELETSFAETLAARHQDESRVEASSRTIEEFEAAGRELIKSADYLKLVLDGVRDLEAQWLDTDERVRESHERGAVDAGLAFHRSRIAEQLEAIHEERDTAIDDLLENTGRLQSLLEPKPRRKVPSSGGGPPPGGHRRRNLAIMSLMAAVFACIVIWSLI